MKTYPRILLALAGLLLPLTAMAPAHATAGWAPDEVLVVDIPDQYVDDDLAERRQGLIDLGLQPGDVVAVKWMDRGHDECLRFYSTCPYLDVDGDLHPVAEDHPFLVPHGPASLDGTRTYPVYAYDQGAVEYRIPGYIGEPVYTDDPNRSGEPVDIIWDGTLLAASDETYDDDGEPYRRVAMGLMDLWVAEEDLAKAEPVDQPFQAEPTLMPEPTETPSAEPTVESDVEAQPAAEPTAEAEEASATGESESSSWVLAAFGGGLLLLAGLVVSLIASAVKGKRSA